MTKSELKLFLAKLRIVYWDTCIDTINWRNLFKEVNGSKQARNEAFLVGFVDWRISCNRWWNVAFCTTEWLKPVSKIICHYEKERFIGFNGLQVALRRLEKEKDIKVNGNAITGT